VLLFDEATSALDPELVGQVLTGMADLAKDGMTMVVVTHEMSFAQDAADEIVFPDHGRVVEVSTPLMWLRRTYSVSRHKSHGTRRDPATSNRHWRPVFINVKPCPR
jgi:ABC-type polar amino acid transport system ATPase subunit